jgi:hypothetical protein
MAVFYKSSHMARQLLKWHGDCSRYSSISRRGRTIDRRGGTAGTSQNAASASHNERETS